jgi:pimeloyl-ACP methyl ester carboxylesterase
MKSSLFILLAVMAATFVRAADAPPMHTGSFDSNGVKIAYVEAGKGEPVILVHGLYSSAAMNWVMPGTFKLLTEHYHVIALDLRGHGNSGKPADDASYGQPMADDVLRLMDHLKIEKAHIAGYSLGGIVVMKFIIDHPERVISAALCGMGWLREGSFEQAMFEKMGDRSTGNTPPACVHGIGRLAVKEQPVKQIKLPVAIIIGDRDPCLRMYVEPLKPVHPEWPIKTVEGAGHITCVMKEQFRNELLKWIEANSR